MRIYLAGLLSGIYLSYTYDVLRIGRRLKSRKYPAVIIEDFLFLAFWGILIFIYLQNECDGILRYYLVLMAFIGMLVYYFALGKNAVPSVVFLVQKALKKAKAVKIRLTRQFQRIKIVLCKRLSKNRDSDEPAESFSKNRDLNDSV